MDEPLDYSTQVLKRRILVDNDDDDFIVVGKHGVVISIKIVSAAQGLSDAHASPLSHIA